MKKSIFRSICIAAGAVFLVKMVNKVFADNGKICFLGATDATQAFHFPRNADKEKAREKTRGQIIGSELFDLLLDIVEQLGIEKFTQGDIHAVTKLFDRDDTRILTFLIQHTVNG